jgi:acetyl-CoA carboxylase biotin carboxyl carrier protein
MDLRKLKTLIDLVSESNVAELEITEAEGKVRIVKAGPTAAPIATGLGTIGVAAPVPAGSASAPQLTAQGPSTAADALPPEAGGHVVKAPMVGTFYRASSPGAKPLVEVGAQVKEGDPICIIEAMKIMNEIDSDRAGTIAKVLVENGQAVEFGQPLFVIE